MTEQHFSPSERGAMHMRGSGTAALLTALLQRDAVRSLTMTDLVVVATTPSASVWAGIEG